jgi:hypothetical protein
MSNGRQTIEALLAVLGIWLVVRNVPDYAVLLVLQSRVSAVAPTGPSPIVIQTIHLTASALTSALLIVSRKRVAQWLHPETGAQEPNWLSVSAGAAVVAVYSILRGIVDLGTYYANSDSTLYLRSTGVVSVLAGALLFIAAPWTERLWRRLNARVARDA